MNPEQIKCACGEILDYLTKVKGSPMADDYPIMSEAFFYTFKCQKCHKNHERHWYLGEKNKEKHEIDYILSDNNYVQLHLENESVLLDLAKYFKSKISVIDFVLLFVGFSFGYILRGAF